VITSHTFWRIPRNLLIASLLAGLLFGQPDAVFGSVPNHNDLVFQRHTQADGISQGLVKAIEQDRAGFLWIGTQDGLNRFDGHQFQVFNHDPFDSTSLSHNEVLCLSADQYDNLWIGTKMGLNLLSPGQAGFRQFRHVPGDHDSRLSGQINCLHPDSRGLLWIGTDTGLVRFDPLNAQFTLFEHDSSDTTSLSDDHVTVLHEDSRGQLWIGTACGLNRVDPHSSRFQRYYPPVVDRTSNHNYIQSIGDVAEDLLWFGTTPGLWSCDSQTGRVTPVAVQDHTGVKIESRTVRGIQQDSLGRIWLASFELGIWLFEPGATEAIRLEHDPLDPGSLSYSATTVLFLDRGDVMWIGTNGYGLNSWSPYRRKFERVAKIASDQNSLHFRSVRACYEDPSGAVWIGGYGGMDRRDPVTGSLSHVSGGQVGNVYTILGDPDRPNRLLWLGTEGRGLIGYDQVAQSIEEYPHGETGEDGLAGNIVFALAADSTGQLWLGTHGGLSRFDRTSEQFTLVHATRPGCAVRAIFFDGQGSLWLGTMDGVAWLESPDADPVYHRHDPDDPTGLSNNHVLCVHEDSRNALWFGTHGGGLNRFDRDRQTFEHYLKRDGLPNNVVYGILEAADGKLWLSTNQGISCFDPVVKTFRNFTAEDGLQDLEFNASAYHHGLSGAFYFGGVSGINIIRPERLQDDPNPAPVVLTDFLLFNRPVSVTNGPDQRRLLTRTIGTTDRLTLSYLDRLVTFEFAALNFTAPSRNRFAYRLQGLNSEWSDLGRRRYVTFTDLKPGEYKLRIRAALADGLWGTASSSLPVVITPPIWETWWFRIGAVTLCGGFLFGVHRRRTVIIRRRNVELKRSRQFLDSIINALDDPVFVKDEQFRWVVLNERACEMLGRPREELLGKSPQEVLPSDWADSLQDMDQEVLRTGGTVVSEDEVTWDGEPRTVSAKKSVFTERGTGKRYIAGSIRDITEFKQVETALRANEARLNSIFRAAPVGVGLAVDRVFVEVNEAFSDMTGFSVAELRGQTARILYDNAEDFQRTGTELIRQIEESGIASLEVILLRKDGSRFDALVCAAPVSLEESDAGLTFTVQDITQRKKMERDLRLTRFTVDHGGDIAIWMDQDARIFYVNDTACYTLGYTREELLSKSIFDLDQQFQPKQWGKLWPTLKEKHFLTIEAEVETRDGRHIPLEVTCNHVVFEGEEFNCAFGKDITERKRAAAALEERLQFESLVSEISAELINPPAGDMESVILDGLRRVGEFFDVDRVVLGLLRSENALFRTVYSWSGDGFQLPELPEGFERPFPNLAAWLRSGEALVAETAATIPDSWIPERAHMRQANIEAFAAVPFAVTGLPEGMFALQVVQGERTWSDDIVPRMQILGELFANTLHRLRTIEALRESQEKYWSILENTGIGIALIDTDMRLLELNRTMRDWFPGIDVQGKPLCYQAYKDPPQDQVCHYCPTIKTLEDGQTHEAMTLSKRGDDFVHYRIVSSAVRNAQGDVVAAIELVEDVTERQRLEDQLRQSQKMEAIGTLAGGIAHDFNNILYAILGYVKLAMNTVPAASKTGGCLEQIEAAGNRAADLVKQILSASRPPESEQQTVELPDLVKEVMKLLRGSLPATVEIKQQIDSNCGNVVADPSQIHQVLMNLCTNAYQSMPDHKGVLEVSLANCAVGLEATVQIQDLKPGAYIRLAIRDDGVGMDQMTVKRIFEPYFTTKPPGEGTGLGLATVHGIVTGMQGAVRVLSEPGTGSLFEIFLPVNERDSQLAPEPSSVGFLAQPEEPGSGHILFVDDEVMLTRLGERVLKDAGYEVSAFNSGPEALAVFQTQPEIYDLVITDVTMPQLTGLELARELRAIRSDIPIALCTGYTDGVSREEMEALGIQECIRKPVALDTLVGIVRKLLRDGKPVEVSR